MLILVRHGESSANAQGLLVGRTDADLTEKGWAQAVSVRQLLLYAGPLPAHQSPAPGAGHRGGPRPRPPG